MNPIPRETLQRPDFRFRLRPCAPEDASELFEAAVESVEHVGKWMGWLTEGYNREDSQTWADEAPVSWEAGSAYEFVICDGEDGDSIAGCCGLNRINAIDKVCNLGYWVRASKLRHGAARQAALLLRDFGWEVLELNRLELVIAVGNEPSRKVAEAAGAVYEGVQRQRSVVGETVHDAWMVALLNPDVATACGDES